MNLPNSQFAPAKVQYGDWKGTVALDNPDDESDLHRLAGIDSDEWTICGIEIHSYEVAGIRGSVLAVRRDLIRAFTDWPKIASGNKGAIPVTEFVFREGTTIAVLREFRRVDIRATLRHAIEDAGIELEVVDTVYPPRRSPKADCGTTSR